MKKRGLILIIIIFFLISLNVNIAYANSQYNFVDNDSFEKTDYSYSGNNNFGKWYIFGSSTSVCASTDVAHSGDASLKICSHVDAEGVGYRIPIGVINYWNYSENLNLNLFAFSTQNTNLTIRIAYTVYVGNSTHVDGFYIDKNLNLSSNVWKNLDTTFSIERNNDNTLSLKCGEDSVKSVVCESLSAIDILVLGEKDKTYYLDDVFVSPTIQDIDSGIEVLNQNSDNKDATDISMLSNAGFEVDYYTDSFSDSAWATSGPITKLNSQDDFVYAGTKSLKISNRITYDSGAFIRLNMSSYFQDSKKYYLSCFVSSLKQTEVVFCVRVYGYRAGEYPNEMIKLASVNTEYGKWSELKTDFTISYNAGYKRIEVNNQEDISYIENCDGVSTLEFFIMTDKDSLNNTTTLFVDNCYLSLLQYTIQTEEVVVSRDGSTEQKQQNIENNNVIKTIITKGGIPFNYLLISLLIMCISLIIYSIVKRIFKSDGGDSK